jgi:death-on-curing protein
MGCTEGEAEGRLRSLARLEGALARPMWHAQYVDPDLAHLAAVLAHGIAEGQHFLDGTKRTAFLAMVVFLERNGYGLPADDDAMAAWIIDLAGGGSLEALADQLRSWMTPGASRGPAGGASVPMAATHNRSFREYPSTSERTDPGARFSGS